METGAVIGVIAFGVLALIGVSVAVIAAVSTVSGNKHTNDEDTNA